MLKHYCRSHKSPQFFVSFHSLVLLLFLTCLYLAGVPAFARQIKGRPTLPSDCSEHETWVSDYSKAAGQVTAFCRLVHSGHAAPRDYQFWAPKIRSGRPALWPHPKERVKPWAVPEIEALLKAMGDIPAELWFQQVSGIYRLDRSIMGTINPASSVIEAGGISLYDAAFKDSKNLPRIMAHELSHFAYKQLSQQDRDSYMMATNWMNPPEGTKGWIQRKDGYVAEDGRNSPDEDFANNVEYFLYDSEKLKTKTPHGYTWIAKHFGANFKLGNGGPHGK